MCSSELAVADGTSSSSQQLVVKGSTCSRQGGQQQESLLPTTSLRSNLPTVCKTCLNGQDMQKQT